MGLYLTKTPSANYGWVGLDVKHMLMRQGAGAPVTLAVRGAYTKTLFVADMNMHALTADVSAGRTFWGIVTPYAGVGGDLVIAAETSKVVSLDTAVELAPHALAGLEVAYWHVALGVEGQLATVPTAQMRVAAYF